MELMMRGMELFRAGGPVMYLILCCSFCVIAIFGERLLVYRTVRPLPRGFFAEVNALLEQGEFDRAADFCRSVRHAAAQVAAAGAACMERRPAERVEAVLESEATVQVAKLRENIHHLESIVTVAPLLGLLGTVVGMMDSFQVMNLKNGQPLAITGGIGEALTATAFGLCVAIAALAAYSYFSHRLGRIVTDIEEVAALLIRHAK